MSKFWRDYPTIQGEIESVKKIIEKNIDEEKNRQLIDEFISEVGN